MLRIEAQGAGGERLTLGRAAWRYLWGTVAIAVAGIGWLWCLVDRDRQAAHDRLAGGHAPVYR